MRNLRFENLELRCMLDGAGDVPVPVTSPTMNLVESGIFYLDSIATVEQQTVIENIGELTPEIGPRDFDNSLGVSGGQHLVIPLEDVPEDALVGSTGAGPCIGLIIVDSENIYVFHFTQTTDVSETIDLAIEQLGNDAHAAIFGGDGSPLSEQTLEEVLDFLTSNPGITIDGYSDTPGLWVDVDGDYHINEVEANFPDDNAPPYIPPPSDPSDAYTESLYFH